MTKHDTFFREPQPAAVFKHKLLEDYLTPWAPKLGRLNVGRVAYLDGYAGAGRYDDGSYGSPVIAMNIARNVRTFANPVDLQCVFVEKDRATANQLQEVVGSEGGSLNIVGPLQGDISEHLDTVTTAIGKRPLLAFLDPFGTSLPAEVLIEKLMGRGRSAPTEVLLNFSIEAVWRMGGHLTSHSRGSAATIAQADTFLGGSWWHEEFIQARLAALERDQESDAAIAGAHVASVFAKRICGLTGYDALSVPVRRTLGTQPFFSLMLFHTNDAAKVPFISAAAAAHKKWRNDYWSRYAKSQEDPDALFNHDYVLDRQTEEKSTAEASVEEITRNIKVLLGSAAEIKVPAHAREIFGASIGTAGEGDLRAARKGLAAIGLIEPLPPSTKPGTAPIRRAP